MKHFCPGYLLLILFLTVPGAQVRAAQQQSVKRFIFDAKKIEGKIRRPQLVLIRADQRPEFSPMAVQSFGKNKNIIDFVDNSILERSPYTHPFRVQNGKVTGVFKD